MMFDNARGAVLQMTPSVEADRAPASLGIADAHREGTGGTREHDLANTPARMLGDGSLDVDERLGKGAGNEAHVRAIRSEQRDAREEPPPVCFFQAYRVRTEHTPLPL